VKRIMYLVMAALVAMLILAPAALAQDVVEGEGDVLAAEWEATVLEHGELEQIAGQPLPKQAPDEPIDNSADRRPRKICNPRVARCPKAAT
jgi:hypothetical protein